MPDFLYKPPLKGKEKDRPDSFILIINNKSTVISIWHLELELFYLMNERIVVLKRDSLLR